MKKPAVRPANPCFGSGPPSKRPGWSVAALEGALVGRSHRSAEGKRRLVEVCERSRRVLGIPGDYRIGILPASDTGTFEAFVERSGWAGFLATRPEIRSPTSVCLTITDSAFTALDGKAQQAFVKDLT